MDMKLTSVVAVTKQFKISPRVVVTPVLIPSQTLRPMQQMMKQIVSHQHKALRSVSAYEREDFRSFIHSWCVDVDDEPTSAKLDFQSVKETNGSGRSCAAENKDKKFVFADENMTGREVDLSATEVDLSETEVDLSETEVEPREAKGDPSEGKGECNEAEVETDIETPCYDLDRSLRTGCQQTAATSRSARAVGSFDPHLEEQQEQTPCHRLEVSDSDKENQSRAGVARKRGSDVLDSDQDGKRRKVRDDASFGNAIDLTEDL